MFNALLTGLLIELEGRPPAHIFNGLTEPDGGGDALGALNVGGRPDTKNNSSTVDMRGGGGGGQQILKKA